MTGVTKEERLVVYKEALKIFKEESFFMICSFGFCRAFYNAAKIASGFSGKLLPDEIGSYPELMNYRPVKGWKKNASYWFNCGMTGTWKRKNILKKIIKEMEANGTN